MCTFRSSFSTASFNQGGGPVHIDQLNIQQICNQSSTLSLLSVYCIHQQMFPALSESEGRPVQWQTVASNHLIWSLKLVQKKWFKNNMLIFQWWCKPTTLIKRQGKKGPAILEPKLLCDPTLSAYCYCQLCSILFPLQLLLRDSQSRMLTPPQ